MSFVALQAHLTFFNSRVLIDLIGKLRKPLRFTDEFGVTVKTLPLGFIDDFCIGDLFVVTNVNRQWAVAAFARQFFMLSLHPCIVLPNGTIASLKAHNAS